MACGGVRVFHACSTGACTRVAVGHLISAQRAPATQGSHSSCGLWFQKPDVQAVPHAKHFTSTGF